MLSTFMAAARHFTRQSSSSSVTAYLASHNLGRFHLSPCPGGKRGEIDNAIGKNAMFLQILLVDDSPGDVRLTREAFRESNISVNLHVASDGLDAMAFLRREGVHADAPRPDVILLDLNLPKMDGREVLTRIKADGELKAIPTIILTSSEAEVDIAMSYQLQANCYLSKPVQFDAFQSVVQGIGDFWLTKVILPRHDPTEHENDRDTSGRR